MIDHDIKHRQEGVHIDSRFALNLGEDSAILLVGCTFRATVREQLTPSV
jgi:hypothetical protein